MVQMVTGDEKRKKEGRREKRGRGDEERGTASEAGSLLLPWKFFASFQSSNLRFSWKRKRPGLLQMPAVEFSSGSILCLIISHMKNTGKSSTCFSKTKSSTHPPPKGHTYQKSNLL
jgi:hypothetical protein